MLKLNVDQITRLNETCKNHFVKGLYLFGSATGNRFDEQKSDIDLVVEFTEDLEPIDFADNFFGFQKKLENIFDRKVDLLSYRALKNPVIIEEIEQSRISLYAAA